MHASETRASLWFDVLYIVIRGDIFILRITFQITVFTKASTTTRERSGMTAAATSADVRMPRINTTSVQRGQLFKSSMYL